MAEVTVWECARCECRGPERDTIRHSAACTDQSEARAITFEMPDGLAPPLFGPR